jgi:hypothetical protein
MKAFRIRCDNVCLTGQELGLSARKTCGLMVPEKRVLMRITGMTGRDRRDRRDRRPKKIHNEGFLNFLLLSYLLCGLVLRVPGSIPGSNRFYE